MGVHPQRQCTSQRCQSKRLVFVKPLYSQMPHIVSRVLPTVITLPVSYGQSEGKTIAFEAAKQLEKAGELARTVQQLLAKAVSMLELRRPPSTTNSKSLPSPTPAYFRTRGRSF